MDKIMQLLLSMGHTPESAQTVANSIAGKTPDLAAQELQMQHNVYRNLVDSGYDDEQARYSAAFWTNQALRFNDPDGWKYVREANPQKTRDAQAGMATGNRAAPVTTRGPGPDWTPGPDFGKGI